MDKKQLDPDTIDMFTRKTIRETTEKPKEKCIYLVVEICQTHLEDKEKILKGIDTDV